MGLRGKQLSLEFLEEGDEVLRAEKSTIHAEEKSLASSLLGSIAGLRSRRPSWDGRGRLIITGSKTGSVH